MSEPSSAPDRRRIALVLQGGGALGSYQAGVYEALAAAQYLPHWVAGISIGAVNAALIVGNPPEKRVAALRAFWEEVSAPTALWPDLPLPGWGAALRQGAALSAIAFGQPGFFRPTLATTSFYDTSALRDTLERLCDFDRINSGQVRLAVGAVNVETGNLVYFDTKHDRLGAEHIMASGALPPGFPPIEIGATYYWDGGLVSNTPLQHVLDEVPRHDMLAFQVDLFKARGPVPTNLAEVQERAKDIRYSSRTRMGVNSTHHAHEIRQHLADLLEQLPPELRELPAARYLYRQSCPSAMDVVNLIYRPAEPQGANKDFEFSRATMQARWAQGVADAEASLRASPWLAPCTGHDGVRSFDVLRPYAAHSGHASHSADR